MQLSHGTGSQPSFSASLRKSAAIKNVCALTSPIVKQNVTPFIRSSISISLIYLSKRERVVCLYTSSLLTTWICTLCSQCIQELWCEVQSVKVKYTCVLMVLHVFLGEILIPEVELQRQVLDAMNCVLYEQLKYKGNELDYYNSLNSYIHQVCVKQKLRDCKAWCTLCGVWLV